MGGLHDQMTVKTSALGIHALGAVRVSRDGVEQSIGGSRQRRLLAVLLIHRDTVVSVDRVAEVVFEGRPSDAAATTLRSYVARLRRTLGTAVVTRSPGYQLDAAGLAIDVVDFETGVQAGRVALQRQDPVSAVDRLSAALALWRGDAYAEFADESWAYPESQRLAELRLTAEELLIEAELACGHAEQVVPVLEGLCREHSLREGFRGQLMRAYYGVGRQADALAVLRSFRTELSEELGIDPSPALVEIEERILAQDPDLLATAAEGEPLRGYRLAERLGTGSDGTVHAARLPGVDRDLVLKKLRPGIADDPEFIRSFEATAHRVAALRHPAVVPLHDWWREPGAAYVVMPRLPGQSLHDRLQRSPLALREVVTLVERVGGALASAAAHGLAHGRVTVDNVLYDGTGEPVLTDFWLGGPTVPSPGDDVRAFAELIDRALAGSDVAPEVARLLTVPDGMTVEALTAELLTALGGHADASTRGRNPYRGLRAFDEADAEDYFGRTALIDEVTARLSGSGLRSRLVLLVGASGTGKSSAVRAGLLPRLRAGGATGSDSWFVATMLPGGAPYKELAESLRTIAVGDTAGLASELTGVDGIDRVLRSVVPEDGQLLLVVDQFEELFTLSSEEEQRAFLEGITHALTVPDSRLRVVATLRADYYDRPLAVQPFGSLVQDATVTISAMLPAEIEAAVVEPARRVERSVDRALAAELVASLASEPAALPALQFVLFELAEHSPDLTLSLAAYRALGGIEGAIASRAEELYRSLDDIDRGQVRELFERLVVVGAEGEPTRRRTDREDLQVPAEVVDQWAAARLLTLDVHPQTRVPTVEVAHEALVREWPRLRQWIEDDRNDLMVLGRIRESAAAWAELGRESSALLRGTALEAALDVHDRRTALTALEVEYVDASQAAREAEQAEQVELIRRQARTNRRLRLQLVGIAVALLVALVGGLIAVDQRRQAVDAEHVAVGRELAAAAEANISADPERSILLALAAVDATRRYDEPVLPEALEALHRGVVAARVLRSFSGVGGVTDWSADGTLFVTEGTEDTGVVEVRDAVTGETVQRFRADRIDVGWVAFSPDSKRLVTAGDEGSVRVWDIATGRKLHDVTIGSEGQLFGLSVSPDGRLVAASWQAGKVRVFPANGGKPWVIGADFVFDTAFSPDSRRLAMGSFNTGEVRVFDVRSRREVLSFGKTFGSMGIAWSPDGRRIAVARPDGAAVHHARTGRLQLVTQGSTSIIGVGWSPDSERLATGSYDGTARVFTVGRNVARETIRLSAQDLSSGVLSVIFSPDGEQLMTSDATATSVKVWDVRETGAAEVSNISGDAGLECGSAVAPDGDSLWVIESGGALGRHDLDTGRQVQRLPRPSIGSAACLWLSPDGRRMAVTSGQLPFPVVDTRTGRVAFVVGEGLKGSAYYADWDASGERLAVEITQSSDNDSATKEDDTESHLRVYDGTGAEIGRVSGEPGVRIIALSFREGGDVIATSGTGYRQEPDQRDIRLWDWRDDRIVGRIEANAAQVVSAPTGELLVSSRFSQGEADVWDAVSGDRVSTLEGHPGIVADVAFDRTGRLVATAGLDGSVRVWDAPTGRQQLALRLPTPLAAAGVEFTPDGERLVTVWADRVTRIWTLDLDELVDMARQRVTRGLTTAECRQYLHTDTCPGA